MDTFHGGSPVNCRRSYSDVASRFGSKGDPGLAAGNCSLSSIWLINHDISPEQQYRVVAIVRIRRMLLSTVLVAADVTSASFLAAVGGALWPRFFSFARSRFCITILRIRTEAVARVRTFI